MSTYALKRVHQVINELTVNMTTQMSNNVDACERVLSWLCDEESREAY